MHLLTSQNWNVNLSMIFFPWNCLAWKSSDETSMMKLVDGSERTQQYSSVPEYTGSSTPVFFQPSQDGQDSDEEEDPARCPLPHP